MNPFREALRSQFPRSFPSRVVVLTGAGISAESGIPTFRGEEGYWKIGSENHFPEELATLSAFRQMPAEIWSWYRYRAAQCAKALPNRGHIAIHDIGEQSGIDFLLVTQNVDNLHGRTGMHASSLFEIHGNIFKTRCLDECSDDIYALATSLLSRDDRAMISADERQLLRCPRCDGWLRPHVLWFDEYYDEEHFRYHSSLDASAEASLLVAVGTSASTSLPTQMVERALGAGAAFWVVNKDHSPFSKLCESGPRSTFFQGHAADLLPLMKDALCETTS